VPEVWNRWMRHGMQSWLLILLLLRVLFLGMLVTEKLCALRQGEFDCSLDGSSLLRIQCWGCFPRGAHVSVMKESISNSGYTCRVYMTHGCTYK
jgi:hypothetical protein